MKILSNSMAALAMSAVFAFGVAFTPAFAADKPQNSKAAGAPHTVRCARISQGPPPRRPISWKSRGTSPQIV